MALPCASVMVIIVLLKLACTCATPEVMFFFSRRRTRALSLAMLYSRICEFMNGAGYKAEASAATPESCLLSSCRRSAWPDLCACAHWCGCAGRGPADPGDGEAAIAAQVHQPLDVHRDFAPQIAFDHIVAVDGLADLADLGVGQLVDAALRRDAAPLRRSALAKVSADAMDIVQRRPRPVCWSGCSRLRCGPRIALLAHGLASLKLKPDSPI